MWGKHIEWELHQAVRGAKNDNQAQQKAQAKLRSILMPRSEEGEEEDSEEARPAPTGQFRDPAAMMMKG